MTTTTLRIRPWNVSRWNGQDTLAPDIIALHLGPVPTSTGCGFGGHVLATWNGGTERVVWQCHLDDTEVVVYNGTYFGAYNSANPDTDARTYFDILTRMVH